MAQRSGTWMTVAEFCDELGISRSTFDAWRRYLEQGATSATGATSQVTPVADNTPVADTAATSATG